MNEHSRIAATPNRRVALLVDGENLAANFAEEILVKAREFGEPNIRRVYGKIDDLKSKGWAASHGFRLMAASNSKNSADLLLSVEAMELALDQQADAIVIAASDHDYTHVALKLRERGFPVYGLIEPDRACDGLRAAYADVRHLNGSPSEVKILPVTIAKPAPHIPRLLRSNIELDPLDRAIFAVLAESECPLHLGTFGSLMKKALVSAPMLVKPNHWGKYLTARPALFKVSIKPDHQYVTAAS